VLDLARIKELSVERKKIATISASLMKQLEDLEAKVKTCDANKFMSDNANDMRNYLNLVNSVYIKVFNSNSEARDKSIRDRNKTDADKEAFVKLKNDYMNEAMADLVRNANEFNKIIEQEGRLIQRADPVFLEPYQSDLGNSHFFAPRKKVFGVYFDTFKFNLCVIWGMSLIMWFTLYFDLLRKLIDGLGNFFSGLSKKKGVPA